MYIDRTLRGIFITLYNKFFDMLYHQRLSCYYVNEFCSVVF